MLVAPLIYNSFHHPTSETKIRKWTYASQIGTGYLRGYGYTETAQAGKREMRASVACHHPRMICILHLDLGWPQVGVLPCRVPNPDTYEGSIGQKQITWCDSCSVFKQTNQHLKGEEQKFLVLIMIGSCEVGA